MEPVDIRVELLEVIWFNSEYALQLLRLLRCREGCANITEQAFFTTVDLLIDRGAIEKNKKLEDFVDSSPLKHRRNRRHLEHYNLTESGLTILIHYRKSKQLTLSKKD
jgi:hypothetical protein